MMNHSKKLKNILFEKGVFAFNSLTNTNNELYHCPLCQVPLSRAHLSSGILTLEHVPPKSQGGKAIALTCSTCNNTAGHSVDVSVANRNELHGLQSILTQKGKFLSRVKLDFGTDGLNNLNYNISVNNSEIRFYPIEKCNYPGLKERIINHFSKPNQERRGHNTSFQVTSHKTYNFQHAKIGDLRTAFLVCFAYFGYRYIFDQRLDLVRNQILQYNEKLIDGYFINCDTDNDSEMNLFLVTKPFFAISVRLGKSIILLPWLESPLNFYDVILKQYSGGSRIELSGTQLTWPKSLEMKLDLFNPSH